MRRRIVCALVLLTSALALPGCAETLQPDPQAVNILTGRAEPSGCENTLCQCENCQCEQCLCGYASFEKWCSGAAARTSPSP